MIHEFKEEYLDLPLEDFLLTFDDGLYSQYKYLKELKVLKTAKIFFISTNIIRPSQMAPSEDFIACSEAHEKAFNENFANYMSKEEILEIYKSPWCSIGGHGHEHLNIERMNRANFSLKNKYKHIKEDVNAMVSSFEDLGIKTELFCYPYNFVDDVLTALVKKNGFEFLFSNDVPHLDKKRIAIEDLYKEYKEMK